MGREIKRVPVDFDWPVNKVWEGFFPPAELRLPGCDVCDGGGATRARQWVGAVTRLLLLLGEEHDQSNSARRRSTPHPYLRDVGGPWPNRPSPDIVELTGGLAGRPPRDPFGHDAIDAWAATAAIVKAAGLPDTWGRCTNCDATGEVGTPEQRAAAEAWKRTEPPEGDGWQVWETVSEGSPITPVFATADALIDHLATVGYSGDWGRDGPLRREAAAALVGAGWTPSGVFTSATGYLQGDRDADTINTAMGRS